MLPALRNAFLLLLDTILPPKPRTERTRRRSLADIPLEPLQLHLLGAQITTLMDYRDPAAQDLIRSLKYDGSQHAARIAAEMLAGFLREEIAEHGSFSTRKAMLVAVPLHSSRERERGFNQVQLLLDSLPEDLRPLAAKDVLERGKATSPQTRFARTERLSNVAGAFTLHSEANVGNCHVYLIDDVTTTGATLVNASQPLRRAGATVSLIALARA